MLNGLSGEAFVFHLVSFNWAYNFPLNFKQISSGVFGACPPRVYDGSTTCPK